MSDNLVTLMSRKNTSVLLLVGENRNNGCIELTCCTNVSNSFSVPLHRVPPQLQELLVPESKIILGKYYFQQGHQEPDVPIG